MKLLIVTQAVDTNNPALAFFHRWITEFAKHVEQVTVICLFEGKHSLPSNVSIHSLGKEKGKQSVFFYSFAFKRLAWDLRHEYDTVFVHMNPEYLVIAGPLWKFLRKRTALWYMHKTVSWRLVLGALFADSIFTASSRSLRLHTRKKHVVGHGVDISMLPQATAPLYPPLALITIGRISPVKRTHILLEAFALLRDSGIEAYFSIAGAPAGTHGAQYEQQLRKQAEGLGIADRVIFLGAVPHTELGPLLAESHLFLHASDTGSLDKASLEPLAVGVPVITVDEELAGAGIPGIHGVTPDAESFAGAIRKAIGTRLWDDESVRNGVRTYVAEHHELTRLIPRILAIVET